MGGELDRHLLAPQPELRVGARAGRLDEVDLDAQRGPAAVGAPYPAAFWAGVDLGNMAGRRITSKIKARALGVPEDGIRAAGIPDMSDGEAFVPPPWVRRLVFVQDGDSDPAETRAKLLAGLRRAMALVPGLQAQIVAAPPGCDLNDVLQRGEAA